MMGHAAGVYHQRKQPAANVSVSELPAEAIVMAEDQRTRFVCDRSTSDFRGTRRWSPKGL